MAVSGSRSAPSAPSTETARIAPNPRYWPMTTRAATARLPAAWPKNTASTSSRQNALASGLKEWGAIRRTIYACRYLADETYRRKIGRQLNKGEATHALRRDLHFAHQGTIGRRHLDQQTEQAWCLTLVSNAIITWTTEYLGRAVEVRRAQGLRIDDDVLAHISPVRTEHVHLVGSIPIDIDREVAVLDQAGYRPLRP